MLSDYSKRAKTTNVRPNEISNQNQGPQLNNYRKIYKNKSPTYYNKYRYEEPNKASKNVPYMKHNHYYQKQNNTSDNYNDEKKLDKIVKNIGAKPAYYRSDFKNMKDSVEREQNFVKRPLNTVANQNQSKISERYYNLNIKNNNNNNSNNNNNNNNLIKSQNERQFANYKRMLDNQNFERGEQKYPPKFYRNNNPLNKVNTEIRKNTIVPVAQKICNIIIKGEANNKKLKNLNKSGKKFFNNFEIEGNVAQGEAVPDKIIDFNLNVKNNDHMQKYEPSSSSKNNEEYENEEEVEEREEGIISVSDRKKGYKGYYSNKKNNTKNEREENDEEEYEEEEEEEEENVKNNDENLEEDQGIDGENEEEYEQDEGMEQEQDQEIEEGHGQAVELLTNINERMKNNKVKENINEEENNRISKEDIEELEEDEIQVVEMNNKNKIKGKNNKINALQLQKGNEIEIEAIKVKKPIMQIQKVEEIQSKIDNDKLERKKRNRIFNIIKDDKIEILGEKKPPIILEKNRIKC